MSDDTLLTLDDVWLEYRTRRSFFRHDRFTALEGLSLQIQRGEVLGVIGSNGCGKSSLLRLLADVYRPDRGVIHRRCRSMMLLSLSLGFDPELSGRENALISGVLLGARKQQMQSKIDDVIAFAELEEQIDNPLKTYSSGMRARLGFSVASAVDAELLLIDEVLSVGDAEFRVKAETAMKERMSSDQTVVFVSHSMPQVLDLCNRVLWLEHGRIEDIGSPTDVVGAYNARTTGSMLA